MLSAGLASDNIIQLLTATATATTTNFVTNFYFAECGCIVSIRALFLVRG